MSQASLVVVVMMVMGLMAMAETSSVPNPHFNTDGYFKMVQFTDLHFGYDDPADDEKTAESMATILDAEQPDLVIITGDVVHGNSWPNNRTGTCLTQNGYPDCWEKAMTVMMKRGIPWAMALGNHDRDGPLKAREIVQLDMKFPLSLTQMGPATIAGATNYVLHVNGTKPGARGIDLWMMDTGSYGCMGHEGYGCVEDTQIAWYQKESKRRLATGEGSPYGLMSVHIPPPEAMALGNSDITSPKIIGLFGEVVCCPLYNTGFVDAVLKQGNVQTLLFGHDHNNDFLGTYSGMTMAYGRKSGFGCYGPDLPLVVGARVIQYHESIQSGESQYTLESWVRNFKGEREDQVHVAHTQPFQNQCA